MASLFKRRVASDVLDEEETLELVARTAEPSGGAERPASPPSSPGRTARALVRFMPALHPSTAPPAPSQTQLNVTSSSRTGGRPRNALLSMHLCRREVCQVLPRRPAAAYISHHEHCLSQATASCTAAHHNGHGCRELPGVVSATVALLSNSAEVIAEREWRSAERQMLRRVLNGRCRIAGCLPRGQDDLRRHSECH